MEGSSATCMSGLSWLGVDVTMSLPSFMDSQAQPEQNLAAPAVLNLVFISSTLPNAESIADFTSELGPLVLEGLVIACICDVSFCDVAELIWTFTVCALQCIPSRKTSGSSVHLHCSCRHKSCQGLHGCLQVAEGTGVA